MKHISLDPHIKRSGISLVKSLYATLGVFIGLFVLFHITGGLYASFLSQKASDAFRSGIAKDTEYLKIQADEVAQTTPVAAALLAGNRDRLLEELQLQASQRSIQHLSIADANGVLVGRTAYPDKYGDNGFLTTAVGHVVAQGIATQSVETTPSGNQLYVTAVRPILTEGRMIGALSASQFLDDPYAAQFRDEYLPQGTQVAFYTKEEGVYSNSFTDSNTRSLIGSYFNSGSEWVQSGSSGKVLDFGNGKIYIVKNIVFPGLEQSPGGVLLFIPRVDLSLYANLLTAGLTLFIFLILALRLHLRTRNEERGWRYYALLALASAPVFVLSFFALQSYSLGVLQLQHVPYPLYNSTLRLEPGYGIYSIGSEQRFSVVIESGDEPINAVQIELSFNPDDVEVQPLDIKNSSCSYVIENTVDQKAGTISLSCVLLSQDAGKRAFPIADIVATPKHAGIFAFSFNNAGTHVLADDGLGTDVLRFAQDSSYRADIFNLNQSGTSTASTTSGRSFVLFSPTHPNESRWYNLPSAQFVWIGSPGAVYRYAFDSATNTTPTNAHTLQGNRVTIPVPGDGSYYFHLQLASGGPVAHYLIKSDRTPPVITAMRASQTTVTKGDVVRFSFDAEDTNSGVQRNYYIDLGGRLFLPVGTQLYVPFLEAGDQKVTLRVYDGAGNYAEKTQTIRVLNK